MTATKTAIGPTRDIRAVAFDNVAPGQRGFFTITPTRCTWPEGDSLEYGELLDWKGRKVACVDLGQPDEDTRYREIREYMQAYWNAMSDVAAETAARRESADRGKAA